MKAPLAIVPVICLLSGCFVTQLEVTNPIPGMSRVAVAPFFNLSHEAAVDGRRVALAYFTELQKVPGYQVVPVGITEQAIFDNQLQMDKPSDVLRLAELLRVDAVVVGSVTDYDPYYPPRIGMQVAWYSPFQWPMFPGVQVDPHARRDLHEAQVDFEEAQKEERRAKKEALKQAKAEGRLDPEAAEAAEEPRRKIRIPIPWYVRGQSPDAGQLELAPQSWHGSPEGSEQATATQRMTWRSQPDAPSRQVSEMQPLAVPAAAVEAQRPLALPQAPIQQAPVPPAPELPVEPQSQPELDPEELPQPVPPAPEEVETFDQERAPVEAPMEPEMEQMPPQPPMEAVEPPFSDLAPEVHVEPVMSYTRMFDGADADLVAALRDYVELSGDRRSGGWEAYLHRSEDFIRFTAHRMILEMLMLHGGEGRRRFVVKHRNVE